MDNSALAAWSGYSSHVISAWPTQIDRSISCHSWHARFKTADRRRSILYSCGLRPFSCLCCPSHLHLYTTSAVGYRRDSVELLFRVINYDAGQHCMYEVSVTQHTRID